MCDIIFLPQITLITRIHFSFFRCALWLRQMRSTDLHRFLPCGISFFRHEDMRTWSFFTEIILLHKFHSLFSLKRLFRPQNARNTRNFIIYFPQITQIKMIFTIRIQRFALLLRKNRSTDLHRFLPYGIFLDMKTREHNLFSLRLFSPTNYTNFTPLFSFKRLFRPRNARNTRNFIIYFPQITQI